MIIKITGFASGRSPKTLMLDYIDRGELFVCYSPHDLSSILSAIQLQWLDSLQNICPFASSRKVISKKVCENRRGRGFKAYR